MRYLLLLSCLSLFGCSTAVKDDRDPGYGGKAQPPVIGMTDKEFLEYIQTHGE